MSDSTLRDLVRARGTELSTEKKDGALDALLDSSAQLTALVDAGKIPTTFVTGLSEWLNQVVSDVEMGQPIPPLGSNTGNATIKPEHRRLIQAVERREIELDASTGLPKAADSDAEVDNVLSALERETGTSKVVGDDNPNRLRRIREDIKQMRQTITTNADQFGKVAEALGLKKDADPADVIKLAKLASDENDKLGDIAEALGLSSDAKPDEIIAAAKTAKTRSSTKSGRLPFPGRS